MQTRDGTYNSTAVARAIFFFRLLLYTEPRGYQRGAFFPAAYTIVPAAIETTRNFYGSFVLPP